MSMVKPFIGIVTFIFCLIVVAIVRLKNPAMTETQLFLSYWWLWLILILICSGLAWYTGRELTNT